MFFLAKKFEKKGGNNLTNMIFKHIKILEIFSKIRNIQYCSILKKKKGTLNIYEHMCLNYL
jgi:hypothetical protein